MNQNKIPKIIVFAEFQGVLPNNLPIHIFERLDQIPHTSPTELEIFKTNVKVFTDDPATRNVFVRAFLNADYAEVADRLVTVKPRAYGESRDQTQNKQEKGE